MLSFPDFKEKNIIIVFSHEGEKVSIRNDNLLVTDCNEKVILQTTCYRMLALWIVGGCTLTSGLMQRSKKFAFPIYLLSYNFRCIGYWNSGVEGNFLLRQKQYSYISLEIAKRLVENKLFNQIELLKSIREKTEDCKNTINTIRQYSVQLCDAPDLQTILGIEGVATRIYFKEWFNDMEWQGRKPRAKRDILNVLLDIGYTFLFYFVENMLNLYGFDVYRGVYHRLFYQRKSLVCDIVEPFRCIVDKQVKKAWNLGQIKTDDFQYKNGQYILKYKESKKYTRWLLVAILENKADIFIYCQSFYRSFMQEKSIENYPFYNISEPIEKQ